MKSLFSITLFAFAILSTQNCTENNPKKEDSTTIPDKTPIAPTAIELPEGFNQYWYAGTAELTTYEVTQERYGELRPAEQVNIFVTEDLSKSKQVKLDDPAAAGSDRVPVLKLNSVRRFHTGIYDYSIMQSVFTPVSGQPTLKSTTTVQDWCGQVFTQTNLESDNYHVRAFSYFENEGDQDQKLPIALLEDEIWSRLRLNPALIPTGKLRVIPSAIYTRLRHKPGAAQNAEISLENGEKESTLTLKYADIPRSLSIRFDATFPHKIQGWEEFNEGKLASKGTLKSVRNSAYWGEHDNIHAPLRDSLKLRF